jgi:hypothetical protein
MFMAPLEILRCFCITPYNVYCSSYLNFLFLYLGHDSKDETGRKHVGRVSGSFFNLTFMSIVSV